MNTLKIDSYAHRGIKIGALEMQFLCFLYLLNICKKFEFLISQGSVATCLRRGGYCCVSFVANFIRFPAVQNF